MLQVIYTSDNEDITRLTLDELLDNFETAGVLPNTLAAIRYDIETSGWHAGTHEHGGYLIFAPTKFGLH